MTVQAFESKTKATEAQIKEAKQLMKNLDFTKTRDCNDGYESWTSQVRDMDSFVALIARARQGELEKELRLARALCKEAAQYLDLGHGTSIGTTSIFHKAFREEGDKLTF